MVFASNEILSGIADCGWVYGSFIRDNATVYAPRYDANNVSLTNVGLRYRAFSLRCLAIE